MSDKDTARELKGSNAELDAKLDEREAASEETPLEKIRRRIKG